MGGVFKLRIVLSGMLDSEETVYRGKLVVLQRRQQFSELFQATEQRY